MATPSFRSAKTVSSLLAKEISAVSTRRRAYAAASAAGAPSVTWKKGTEDSSGRAAWIPDPKTGCYRPEDAGNQVDPADLREMFLKNKSRWGHEKNH